MTYLFVHSTTTNTLISLGNENESTDGYSSSSDALEMLWQKYQQLRGSRTTEFLFLRALKIKLKIKWRSKQIPCLMKTLLLAHRGYPPYLLRVFFPPFFYKGINPSWKDYTLMIFEFIFPMIEDRFYQYMLIMVLLLSTFLNSSLLPSPSRFTPLMTLTVKQMDLCGIIMKSNNNIIYKDKSKH